MKKLILIILGTMGIAAFALPAAAIVLTPEAAVNVTSSYATVTSGKVIYDKTPTAYSSAGFNKILEAYGLNIHPETVRDLPASYAKVLDGKVLFDETPIAYEPVAYHSIFTSYGLQLSPEDVISAKLGSVDYADVVGGKIVFGKTSTAYDGEGLALILSAYKLPVVVEEPQVSPSNQAAEIVDTDQDGVPDTDDACPGTPMGAKVDERGCWTLNTDYLFDFDKSVVKVQYYPYLDELIPVMEKNPNLRVEIQGHTDSTGTNRYNQGLSERRAMAIGTYLVNKSIEVSRLTAVAFGEEQPAYSNDTSEGRAKNRRVELKPIE